MDSFHGFLVLPGLARAAGHFPPVDSVLIAPFFRLQDGNFRPSAVLQRCVVPRPAGRWDTGRAQKWTMFRADQQPGSVQKKIRKFRSVASSEGLAGAFLGGLARGKERLLLRERHCQGGCLSSLAFSSGPTQPVSARSGTGMGRVGEDANRLSPHAFHPRTPIETRPRS